MWISTTRRRFLEGAAATGLLTTSARCLAGGASSTPVRVRREIYGLAAGGPEIASLRRGIAAMQARPAGDPTSWLFQANIHGTYDSLPPGSGPASASWNTCQHGSFFFLSWHRMYLYHFERILRAASGEPSLTLPYWDYGASARRALPESFRQPANATNPLFVAARNASINAGQPLPASATGSSQALATRNFASATGSGESFGGQTLAAPSHFTGPPGRLELQPHNVIHVAVGGNGGWMADPNFAARDPIFWLHHANIDRLWNRWLAQGGGRRNPTTGPWTTAIFSFVDASGAIIRMTGADVVDSARQLLYRYDDEPVAIAAAGGTESEAMIPPAPSRVLAATATTESATRLGARDTTLVLAPHVEGGPESAVAPGRPAVLSFDDIAYRRPVGFYYEVYLNRPANAPADPEGPYYAGNLAFFALGHTGPEGVTGARLTLDAGEVLANQMRLGLWRGGEVKVDLHPIGGEATEAEGAAPLVTVGQVRLLGN
jgi:Common central domain of tyrosinase